MTTQPLPVLCNAWIYLNEDEPVVNGQHLPYPNPASSYQRLISHNIYQAVDILFLCFAETEPAADGTSYTLRIRDGSHPQDAPPPPEFSNQDYMNFIIRDSRDSNPNIKISMTLDYGRTGDEINQIFSNTSRTDAQNAESFAANLMAYLQHYDIDGFDIDWEYPLSNQTTEAHMSALLTAVGTAFRAQTTKKYYLTLAPNTSLNLDGAVVNANVDFLSLQLYGAAGKGEFTSIGVAENLLAYGAKFESNYQTAQQAYAGYQEGGYKVATQWRLNSGNFEYEQDQQVEFFKLIHGT